MPRIARVVAVGLPHHITQRGNYQQEVFLDDNDRIQYLTWVNEYSKKSSLIIFAYCLMSNHVHFIALPEKEDSLAKTFNSTHMRYSQYHNRKKGVRGHLWQGRFYSCVLDENHLYAGIRYVERNPVRAGMVREAWDWKWSSAQIHTGAGGQKSGITLGDVSSLMEPMNFEEWKRYLEQQDEEGIVNEIRKRTLTGRPLGNEKFIKQLEEKLGKRLIA